jgi:hypothetical protein
MSLLNFEFNVDPDPVFPSNADPCGSGYATLLLSLKDVVDCLLAYFLFPESLCLSFRPVGFNEELVADTVQVLLEGFVLKRGGLNVVFSLLKCVRLYRMYLTCLNSGDLSLHTKL